MTKSKKSKKSNPASTDKTENSTNSAEVNQETAPAAEGKSKTESASATNAESASAKVAEAESANSDPLAGLSEDELRDMIRRVAAERENVARRALTEIQKARKTALNSFAKGICEVCDCLQAALDGEGEMREGVELTLRKLTATMESNGIRPVRPDVGANFDPSLHEAIGINNEAGKDENTVASVVQNGYTLDGQVVRAAQIIVYKSGG